MSTNTITIATKADADDVNNLAENLAAKDADLETQVTQAAEQLNTNVDALSTSVEGMQMNIDELATVGFPLIFRYCFGKLDFYSNYRCMHPGAPFAVA